MASINSFKKYSSSLLFLASICLLVWTCSLKIGILTVREAWSEVNLQLGWIEWLSYSSDSGLRNIRSITELKSYWLSEYLVGKYLVGLDNSKWRESTNLKRISLCNEWCGKSGSQILSLILKSVVMIRTLPILTSVSLRYFKANWDESE